ncbi:MULTISPECIES: universal stress protein [Ramlibacter]|uniref:Universal stress protein n=1 Tax=Ramlibacter pinisoli TaxID=2682844 RepID=A0A6N8IPK3_9BURK|nr:MULTISPECIES: universal stress protein [Ramlibacter]MBA2963263.1 universal stress protein [Ramlibacter sp. CGMCC 1.13660]MVQ28230.1 universal stress protein [Ramlibacter pinisoli]
MQILLPVDGSEYTKRMLAYIGTHHDLLGTEHDYTAFTVVHSLSPHAARFLDPAVLADYYAEQADEVLRPVQAYAAEQGWRMKVARAHGPAAKLIALYAQEHAQDLIVMGAHGHSALGNMVMGSTTNGVLARCKVPVLLIR